MLSWIVVSLTVVYIVGITVYFVVRYLRWRKAVKQLTAANVAFRNEVGAALLPALQKMADDIKDCVDELSKEETDQ